MSSTDTSLDRRARQVAERLRLAHGRLLRGLTGLAWESSAAVVFRATAEHQLRGVLAGAEAAESAADALAHHARRAEEVRAELRAAAAGLLREVL
ncbi:hypothetical protein CLV35_1920 [Motilibacter peucedani]|uniref:Uncharacterized protein n=1 Tax=Motilibacter peucedani TaxID=598650 RepID=A0A420XQ91_9ACTN|nr:hypothetical protein [Motilibacter peucedani]RKS75453.1 hypothetical protein CLV35_1920 [Motilibacter peucedani]